MPTGSAGGHVPSSDVLELLDGEGQLIAEALGFHAVAFLQAALDPGLQVLALGLQLQVLQAEMLLIDHLPEGPGAHGPDGALLHEEDRIGAVHDGIEIVGDHEHRAPVAGDRLLQGDLGEGIQMAGGPLRHPRGSHRHGRTVQFQLHPQ